MKKQHHSPEPDKEPMLTYLSEVGGQDVKSVSYKTTLSLINSIKDASIYSSAQYMHP
jgi:hypothetical protein